MTLSKYKVTIFWCWLMITLVLFDSLLGLYTQGFYGPVAVAQQIMSDLFITLCELTMLIVIIRFNLDLKLQVQVLHNGEMVLVGLDDAKIERIKLELCEAVGDNSKVHN